MTLIERLRKGIVTSAPYEPQYTVPPAAICLEAADEIERLTAEEKMQLEQIVNQGLEIERLTGASKSYEAQANKDCLEIERLTAELAEMKADRDALSVAAALWNHRYIDACQQHNDRQTNLGHEIVALEAECNALASTKDGAYLECNQLVALLSKVFPAGKKQTAIEGWSEDWHGCVYIDLPTGQASWHYHDSQAYLFDHLPEYQGVWDGHTTNEKYERIAAIQGAGK